MIARIPFPGRLRRRWMRWHLNRIRAHLRREGWIVDRRYNTPIPLLHVRSPSTPHIGESVLLLKSRHGWHYRSSNGDCLASHRNPALAADQLSAILTFWTGTTPHSQINAK
ncbi:hypothetical protein [Actinomadura rupiterrae]|uniref:hypothetical protein n=1 Tax=Actinomadura rupiterrae TaxID=559627 RepID=UPI0020A2F4C0|nr:hypothetical protein [Actinomadura rupiterrae]MCP2336815.1 hypothetical protein [Actinomadura rupiterrae]